MVERQSSRCQPVCKTQSNSTRAGKTGSALAAEASPTTGQPLGPLDSWAGPKDSSRHSIGHDLREDFRHAEGFGRMLEWNPWEVEELYDTTKQIELLAT